MTDRILCVDDDANILAGFQRNLRKQFSLDTAVGGAQGLAAVDAHGPYAVVVADMQMPGMNGLQFLNQVERRAPSTVRVMLTGSTDQRTAIGAVNEGHVFRFLTKPCTPELLAEMLVTALEQYRIVSSEREVLARSLVDAQKARSLQRLLGRYVSTAVAEAAVTDEKLLQARRTHAAVLFGDIRGFTSYCASHQPGEIAALLNAYYQVACRVVEQEGGVVNKFIGDGFLALFDPRDTCGAPERAAACAARRLLRELPGALDAQHLKPGLAIGSGDVVVGELGSQDRCEFSVIGDVVNRTARLEGLNSILGATCLVTKEVAACLSPEFSLVDRGTHLLKGLSVPVRVMELLNDSQAVVRQSSA